MYFHDHLDARLSTTLDLSRWIAAGLVVLSHVRDLVFLEWSRLPADQHTTAAAMFYSLTSLGHVAVIIFFVLSGFLVGGSVVNGIRRGNFSFTSYLVNRISRLYVVLIPAFLIGYAFDAIGMHWFNAQGIYSGRWPHFLGSLQYSVDERTSILTLAANACNLQTILTPTFGSNGPLWSLANEFWYYVIFPLLLAPFMTWKAWRLRALLFALSLAVGAIIYPTILFYGVFWAMGVAIRCVPRALVPWPWLSAIIAIAAVAVGERLPHHHVIVALALANLLLTLMHRGGVPVPGFSSRLNEALAGFSYSLYLLHYPLLLLMCAAANEWWGIGLSAPPADWANILVLSLSTAVVYLFAWAVSLLTERQTHHVRQLLMGWFGERPR